ncbi:MAG: UvrD-helicase domain-containing protein [Spirochaetaceae bacterium]|nr:MAG: UvrD-helicase domain-containing protein [Spirochaetaceae bacterium]
MVLSFDENQNEAIGIHRNSVVMAGAGSGKTAVIAERYCRLLEHSDIGVERILALTFTQKAAAEMYERIRHRLLHAQEGLRRHLASFEQAQISTLDSFCAEILANAGDSFGLPQDFRYDEQAVARLAEQFSLDFLLENLDSPAVQEMLHLHGFETLWKDLFTDLARYHLHLPGQSNFAAMARTQIDRCRMDLSSELKRARTLVEELLGLEPRTLSIKRTQEMLVDFHRIGAALEGERYQEALEQFKALQFKKPGGRGGEDIQRLKALIDLLRPGLKTLGTLSATLAGQRFLLEIFSLLERFAAGFIDRKRSLGLVTFQDVANLAVEALIRDKSLRQFYKSRYRYIMIDEFQDNNRLQKDLLFLLSERLGVENEGVPSADDLEPEKLFFVGDEKQSIYRFRGAEVGVFKSLHKELESAGGRTIALDRNYRSGSGLIEFVNTVFSVVMAEAQAEYEARYQRMRKGGPDSGLIPRVHLFYGDQERSSEAAQDYTNANLAEAHEVVRFIQQTVERQALYVPSGEGTRPALYDDFAVLLRSTGNQIHYERMFRHFAVPYSTDNLRSLFTEAPINDFYLLLQLAVYPEDRAAYAGVLRSPFVNCSDETAIRILLDRPPGAGDRAEPFSELDSVGMSGEDRQKLQRGREIYLEVRDWTDRIPIAEIFHRLWYRYGYRYTILRDPRNHNYLEYFDYMIKLAERADRQGDSLVVFLDFLRQNLGRYERLEDLTVLKPRRPGVQLLTIHRSKGLEFPIVVLADMGNLGRIRRNGIKPYYFSTQYGITINLGAQNYFTEIGEQESEKEELAEIKRLLYVALTRAQFHLVLAGTHKQRNRSSPRAHLNLLLRGLGLSEQSLTDISGAAGSGAAGSGSAGSYNLEVHRIAALSWRELGRSLGPAGRISADSQAALYAGPPIRRTVPRRDITVTELCRHLDPLLDHWRERRNLKSALRRLPSIEVDVLLNKQGLEARFGVLTHQLLSRWGADPTAPPPEPDWTRIPKEHRDQLFSAAVALCRNFLDSELGALSVQAERVERELPFMFLFEDPQGPLYISGQIDLAFEWQEHLYLVDFKTDRNYRSGEHEGQLELYRLALREQTDNEIYTFLFLLRTGEAVRSDASIDVRTLIPQVRHLL